LSEQKKKPKTPTSQTKQANEKYTIMSETSVVDPRAISRDVFSATIGSVCCCYTGQPFDTVKVRMQTSPDQFSGVVQSTTSILRNEVRQTNMNIAIIAKGQND